MLNPEKAEEATCYAEISACHAGMIIKQWKNNDYQELREYVENYLQNARFIISIPISARVSVTEMDLRMEISRQFRKSLSPEEFFALSFLNGHQRSYFLEFNQGKITPFNSPKYLNKKITTQDIYFKPSIDIYDVQNMFGKMVDMLIGKQKKYEEIMIQTLSSVFIAGLFGNKDKNGIIASTLGISKSENKLSEVIAQAIASGMRKYGTSDFLSAIFNLNDLSYAYEMVHRIQRGKSAEQMQKKEEGEQIQKDKSTEKDALISVLRFVYLSVQLANGLSLETENSCSKSLMDFANKILSSEKMDDLIKNDLLLEFGAICASSNQKLNLNNFIKISNNLECNVYTASILYAVYESSKEAVNKDNVEKLHNFISTNKPYGDQEKYKLLIAMCTVVSQHKSLDKILDLYELLLETEPYTQIDNENLAKVAESGLYTNNKTYIFDNVDINILENDYEHNKIKDMKIDDFIFLFNMIDFKNLSTSISAKKNFATDVSQKFLSLFDEEALDKEVIQKISYSSLLAFINFVNKQETRFNSKEIKESIQKNDNFLCYKQAAKITLETFAKSTINHGIFFASLRLSKNPLEIEEKALNAIFEARIPNTRDTAISEEYLLFINVLDAKQIASLDIKSLQNIFACIEKLYYKQVRGLAPESVNPVVKMLKDLSSQQLEQLGSQSVSDICSFISKLTTKQLLAASSFDSSVLPTKILMIISSALNKNNIKTEAINLKLEQIYNYINCIEALDSARILDNKTMQEFQESNPSSTILKILQEEALSHKEEEKLKEEMLNSRGSKSDLILDKLLGLGMIEKAMINNLQEPVKRSTKDSLSLEAEAIHLSSRYRSSWAEKVQSRSVNRSMFSDSENEIEGHKSSSKSKARF